VSTDVAASAHEPTLQAGCLRVLPTFAALAVLIVAVLPGAAYTFAFEREAGDFGVTVAHRALRSLASLRGPYADHFGRASG
jgi:hypothetical protein